MRTTLTSEILQALSTARYGLSSAAIFEQCTLSDDPDTFKAMLCMTAKFGYVRREEFRATCETCKTTHVCYRITDKGRMRLKELTPEVA